MGNLQGVNINKIDGGNGRLSDINDKAVLLVSCMPVTATSLVVNKAERLLQAKDAETLGVTESFDANNKSLAQYHISEIFRLAPETTVYLLPVATGEAVADTFSTVLETLRSDANIKSIGFVGFANGDLTASSALTETVQTSLVVEAKKEGILIDAVFLEAGSAGALALNAYPDLTTKSAENVSLILAQDPAIAALETEYANHSAIGSALGMFAVRKMSENLGSTNIEVKPNDKKGQMFYPLTDAASGRWAKAGLSTGQKIEELSNTQLKDLSNKGYIFAGPYVGASGMYFSGSDTCTSKTSKYSTIENNSVFNGAARLIREALSPFIKGKVKKDPATGYIRSTTIAHWEQVATKACIERLEAENEISGGNIYINPKQVPDKDHPVQVKVTIVSDEIAHTFDVDLSLT